MSAPVSLAPELASIYSALNTSQKEILKKVGSLTTAERSGAFKVVKRGVIRVTYFGDSVDFNSSFAVKNIKALARELKDKSLADLNRASDAEAPALAAAPAKSRKATWILAAIGITALVAAVALVVIFGVPAPIASAATQAWAYTGTLLAALRNRFVSAPESV